MTDVQSRTACPAISRACSAARRQHSGWVASSRGEPAERAGELSGAPPAVLPVPGERVAVTGCGTSWYAVAEARGLDPDRPRGLSHSVILL